jgi:hypothetical protein
MIGLSGRATPAVGVGEIQREIARNAMGQSRAVNHAYAPAALRQWRQAPGVSIAPLQLPSVTSLANVLMPATKDLGDVTGIETPANFTSAAIAQSEPEISGREIGILGQ